MSETPLSHEHFARLMSLPLDHPERIAWNGRPEFESMRALYEQFEGARAPGVSERELREAEDVLERRFRDALPAAPRAEARPQHSAGRQERTRRPWWDPFPRPAFAAAAVLIVAIGGVWFTTRPRPSAMRGVEDVPVILEPRQLAEGLEFRWTPVSGVSSYRLSFVDESMREVAVIESWPGTSYRIETSKLPPGLAHGAHLILQIQPVRNGVPERTAGTRSIVVP